MNAISLNLWLSLVTVLLAVLWVLYPESNLEPLIVFLLAFISFRPLIRSEFIPWYEHRKATQKNFKIIRGSSKINAIEVSFQELIDNKFTTFNLIKQKFFHYPTEISIFFEQNNFKYVAHFQNGHSIVLKQHFKIGKETEENAFMPKQTNHYFFVQFDIDDDGIDEIIFGLIDKEDLQNVQLTVYKYHPPLLENDLPRAQNWSHIGTITANTILGDVRVLIEKGTITIPRNLRGFYYKWAFIGEKIADIGEY